MKQKISQLIEAITQSGQNVHRPMTAFFSLVFVFTFIIVFILAVKLTNDIFLQHVDSKLSAAERYYQDQIAEQVELQEVIALSLVNDKEIIEIVKNQQGFEKFDQIFKALNPYKITHFYMFSPQRVVIHRAHSPNRKGDQINRANLLEAESSQKTVTGLELGKIGAFTLRTSSPVYLDNNLIGYIEVGMELGHIAERTEQNFGVLLYEFFDRKVATKNRNKLFPLSDRFTERELVEDYIINAAEQASFETNLINKIIQTHSLASKQTLSDSKAIRTSNIYNFSGQTVGFMATVSDVSSLYQQRNDDLLNIALFAIILGLTAIAIINLVFRYLEQSIKNYSEKQKHSELQIKQNLQKLKDTQDIIVEREKYASLGSMVAGIAHEVNTPLGVSLTAGTAVLNETYELNKLIESKTLTQNGLIESSTKIHDLAKLIDSNLHRASDLVQSFKQVAVDQSSEQPRQVRMKKLFQEIVTSLKPQLKRGQHQAIVICEDELVVNTVPGYWTQILFNLMNNSLIHGFSEEKNKIILIELTVEGKELVLVYKDDGKGLDFVNKKKVFEPFYTTKRNEGGSGLGMHLVFNIVTQALGGTIEIVEQDAPGLAYKITTAIS